MTRSVWLSATSALLCRVDPSLHCWALGSITRWACFLDASSGRARVRPRVVRRSRAPRRVRPHPRRRRGLPGAADRGHRDHGRARRGRPASGPGAGSTGRTARPRSPASRASRSTTPSGGLPAAHARLDPARTRRGRTGRRPSARGARRAAIDRAHAGAGAALGRVAVRAAGVERRPGDVEVHPRQPGRHELARRTGRRRACRPTARRAGSRCRRRGSRASARSSSGSGIAQAPSPAASAAATTSSRQAGSPMAPIIRVPSATIWAPVSVDTSMSRSGSSSAARVIASARMSRPSASVSATSTVRPPYMRRTSDGR